MQAAWESHKMTIRRLYLEEDKTKQQVMEDMERLHGFNANEKQYERQFKKWKFRKNLKDTEWKFVSHRVEKRKKEDGKESDLMIDGILVPQKKLRKEINRHSFESVWARYDPQTARRSPTPEGVVIHTPPALPLDGFRYINLPWFELQRSLGHEALLFRQTSTQTTTNTSISAVFRSLVPRPTKRALQFTAHAIIPTSHFGDLYLSADRILDNDNTNAFFDDLLLAIMLGSNRLDNEDNLLQDVLDQPGANESLSAQLAKILPNEAMSPILQRLLSIGGPEIEAFTEIMFKNALLQNNVQLVRMLLSHTNVSPNDELPGPWHFRTPHFLDLMKTWGPAKPLEIAIRTENVLMAQTLLYHDADINDTIQHGDCPLWVLATWFGHKELLDLFLDFGVDDIGRGLVGLIRSGDFDLVSMALDQGANANSSLPTPDNNLPRFMTPLSFAAEEGNLPIVKLLLQWGADVNLTEEIGMTPLQKAVLAGHVDIATFLLENGACTERILSGEDEEYDGLLEAVPTPIQIAAAHHDLEMASLLLEHGANVNAAPPDLEFARQEDYDYLDYSSSDKFEAYDGQTALMQIVGHWEEDSSSDDEEDKRRMVELLLRAGADVNASPCTGCGGSVLTKALQASDPAIVQLLLDAGARCSIPIPDKPGMVASALISYARKGELDKVKTLCEEGEDINALNQDLTTPLTAAILGSHDSLARYLISQGANINHPLAKPTPLQAAIEVGHDDMVDYLLRMGARPDDPFALRSAVSRKEYQLVERLLAETLRYAAPDDRWHRPCYEHPALCLAIAERDFRMMETIVRTDVDRSCPSLIGALCGVCKDGDLPFLHLLLSLGIPVNFPEILLKLPVACAEIIGDSPFPLHVAILYKRNEITRTLLEHGAGVDYYAPYIDFDYKDPHYPNINFSSSWMGTALNTALRKDNSEVIDLLLNAGVNVNLPARTHFGRTALQQTVEKGNVEMVDRLLVAGADVNAAPASNGGVTALQAAAIKGFLGIAVKLLEAGADVNAKAAAEFGRTALEGAAEYGRIDMLQLLLDAGADVESKWYGRRQYEEAVRRARENGHNAAARLLERHRANLS